MPLGQPAGVRNSGVVLAFRVGIFLGASAPGPRPSSSTPEGRWAKAADAPKPSPMVRLVARNWRLSMAISLLRRFAAALINSALFRTLFIDANTRPAPDQI